MKPPLLQVLRRFGGWALHALGTRVRLAIAGILPVAIWTAALIGYGFAERAGHPGPAVFLMGFWSALVAFVAVMQLRDVLDFFANLLTGEVVVRRVPSKAAMKEFEASAPVALRLFALAIIYSSPITMLAMWSLGELYLRGAVEVVEDDSLFEKREQYRMRFRGGGRGGLSASIHGAFRTLQSAYRGDAVGAVHQPN